MDVQNYIFQKRVACWLTNFS